MRAGCCLISVGVCVFTAGRSHDGGGGLVAGWVSGVIESSGGRVAYPRGVSGSARCGGQAVGG